jgi:hypothetical protein
MRDYLVYSLSAAKYLMNEGFIMKDIRKNKKFDHKLVFFFKDDPKIVDAINEYKALIKQVV